MQYELSSEDWARAAAVEREQTEQDRAGTCRDLQAATDKTEAKILAAAAELALARFLGLEWTGDCTFEERKARGDVGSADGLVCLECRHTRIGMFHINPRDVLNRRYVFLEGGGGWWAPDLKRTPFLFAGWLWGKEAVKPQWKARGKYEVIWVVPREALRPCAELFNEVARAGSPYFQGRQSC